MRIAVYPGSFDPVTLGHIDIISRSSRLFDKLIVGVLINSSKIPLFSAQERVNMIKDAVIEYPNVEVQSFDGLLVDFARMSHATAVVRGLRAVTDFEYELQMSQTNHIIASDIDTIFLTTNLNYAYLSSSVVKEVARYGGDISKFVTPQVRDKVLDKYNITAK
ncbi:MAG: pantetheine-phosphate adenylyltransferase [Lachnospiraceae bacterium]